MPAELPVQWLVDIHGKTASGKIIEPPKGHVGVDAGVLTSWELRHLALPILASAVNRI